MGNNSNSKNNMNILIGNTLRIGVLLACVIALLGGIWYIVSSSGMGLPDYSVFKDGGDPSYTTFSGIIHSVLTFSPIGWVQLSVVVLHLSCALCFHWWILAFNETGCMLSLQALYCL